LTDTINAMSFDESIRSRRSVRGFLSNEVPDSTLKDVFQLAQLTPSNCNVQPWLPHVVSGQTMSRLREALIKAASNGIPPDSDWPSDGKFTGIYRQRQVDAAVKLYDAMGIERTNLVGRQAAYIRNQAFFDAPHAVFIFLEQPFDTREAADIGMYAQSLMLAMTSRGIASCAQGALGLYPNIIREHLDLSSDHRLLFGISFGYEDPKVAANLARVGRADLSQVVQFHR
jgi:nitroreductase